MQHYHPHARLTTHGRARLLHVVASGTPVADACADTGVSRTTYSHWRQRFASEGLPGLADGSSRPRCPRMALTPAQEQAITGIRTGLAPVWAKRGWQQVFRVPVGYLHWSWTRQEARSGVGSWLRHPSMQTDAALRHRPRRDGSVLH